tara:strand:+ start:1089 stop:1481 length:393 start_codon:yes stop_codon:yes gene_type:complete
MKKVILIFFLIPALSFSQSYNESYKEFNFGVITNIEGGVFPGASYLWGKTHYYNNTLLDYQAGFAFPTIVTGKIGFGLGGSNFATIIGFRPWPSTAYLQFSINQRFNFSIEGIVPELYGEGFILTYGIRF